MDCAHNSLRCNLAHRDMHGMSAFPHCASTSSNAQTARAMKLMLDGVLVRRPDLARTLFLVAHEV